MKEIIEKHIHDRWNAVLKSQPELLKFLMRHERKHLLVNNLIREMKNVERQFVVQLTAKKIESICNDFADTFAKVALNYEGDRKKTELAKHVERQKALKFEDDAEMIKEIVEEVVDRSESI